MAEPTAYDEIQDGRLDDLESLITAEYQPPEGTEYSFPVSNQGITQDQFRLMHLGQANGMIHGNNGIVNDSPDSTGYRYYLDRHDSDSETNQRNTLILRAGTSAESIVEGFYHRLTEDLELPFPPVTTTTVYHVTITYDPRDFKTNPVRIQVYPGEPPTSHGRVHLLLHTVERRANQLLSQATVTRYRPYTAGIVAVQNERQLPDVDSYPAGTLAVPSSREATGVYVRSNTSPKRWINTMTSDWENLESMNGWRPSSPTPRARRTPLGVQLVGRYNGVEANNSRSLARLPEGMRPARLRRFLVAVTDSASGGNFSRLEVDSDGILTFRTQSDRANYVELDNVILPLD